MKTRFIVSLAAMTCVAGLLFAQGPQTRPQPRGEDKTIPELQPRPGTGGASSGPSLRDQALNKLAWDGGPEGDYYLPSTTKFHVFAYQVKGGQGEVKFTVSSVKGKFSAQRPSGMPQPPFLARLKSTQVETAAPKALVAGQKLAETGAKKDGQAKPAASYTGPKRTTLTVYYDRDIGWTGQRSGFRSEDFDNLTVTAKDSTGKAITKQLKLKITMEAGKPKLHNLYAGEDGQLDNPNLTYFGYDGAHDSFKFYLTTENWSVNDPDSEAIVEYADGFKCVLPVELHGPARLAGGQQEIYKGGYFRFNKAEPVKVFIRNGYGTSAKLDSRVWNYIYAEWPSGPLSPAFIEARERRGSYDYGRDFILQKHPGPLLGKGVDKVKIIEFLGGGPRGWTGGKLETLACGKTGVLYKGARIYGLNVLFAKATIKSEPKIGELLKDDSTVEVEWEHGVPGITYQLHFRYVPVDGVCQDLIRR